MTISLGMHWGHLDADITHVEDGWRHHGTIGVETAKKLTVF